MTVAAAQSAAHSLRKWNNLFVRQIPYGIKGKAGLREHLNGTAEQNNGRAICGIVLHERGEPSGSDLQIAIFVAT